MMLQQVSSPHLRAARPTEEIMLRVLLALVPGIIAMAHFFGPGVFTNMLVACVSAVLCESLCLSMRDHPVLRSLRDYSAVVTAVLLALALPPYSPWWLIAIGTIAAIGLAKHVFGGLGNNPFNPAMVGYVVLLVSFPVHMTQWTAPSSLATTPGIWDSVLAAMGSQAYDAVTMATPLDLMRQNDGLMVSALWQQYPQFGRFSGVGWEWINLAFLAGGLWLLQQKIFNWHAPVGMLAALGLMSALFYDGGSSASGGSPLFHWLSGATMLGAFFIITDPVSGATSNLGRLIFGALVGLLVYCIRVWGSYPDAVAFAVLLMNFAAPFIDYYTQPKPYGQQARDSEK
ncbi:electron transport complex subunit RsxD [Aequoribacter sp.]|uniref:electron transport complex subunit RsxD n=1 Tax=Aequoribacter sp. TaxID=2847771 RepID=UPI003F6987C2